MDEQQTDGNALGWDELHLAESMCLEGTVDRLAAALGIDGVDPREKTVRVQALSFQLVEVAIADLPVWAERQWDSELAERPGYLGALRDNIGAAPPVLLAPNLTGETWCASASYAVGDGMHRINAARAAGRTTVTAYVAVV